MTYLITMAIAWGQPIPDHPHTVTAMRYEKWTIPSDGSAATYHGETMAEPWNLLSCCGQDVVNHDYWDMEYCPAAALSPQVVLAVDNLKLAGAPLRTSTATVAECHYPSNGLSFGDWLERPEEGPQGADAPDFANQVAFVWALDDRFEELDVKSDGTSSLARTDLFGVMYSDEDGNQLAFHANWDTFINGRDFNYLPGCPSKATNWHAKTVGVYAYDTALHEILHAFGVNHIEGDPTVHNISSAHAYTAGAGGHLGLEAFGDPYDPNGAECGERVLPLADQILLQEAWPEFEVEVDERGLLFNWQYVPFGANYRAVPIFWGQSVSLGSYCPGEYLTEGDQTTLQSQFLGLRFTKHTATLSSGAAAALTPYRIPGWTEGSSFLNLYNHMAWYTVVGTGQWFGEDQSGADIYRPPGGDPTTEVTNTRIETSNPAGHAWYQFAANLQEVNAPSVYLPVKFELKPDCSAEITTNCCGG